MKVIMCALRGRGGRSGERDSWHLRLEIGEKDVSNTIDTVQKDYLLMEIYERDSDSGQDRPAPAGQVRFRKYGNPLMYYHKIVEE